MWRSLEGKVLHSCDELLLELEQGAVIDHIDLALYILAPQHKSKGAEVNEFASKLDFVADLVELECNALNDLLNLKRDNILVELLLGTDYFETEYFQLEDIEQSVQDVSNDLLLERRYLDKAHTCVD